MRNSMGWIVGLGLMVAVSGVVRAESMDPLQVAPEMYTLKFENERVRVMEVGFKPGASIGLHTHPDHAAIAVTGGTLQISKPDGSKTDLVVEPGTAVWIPAEAHSAVNTGQTDVRVVVVELKEPAPAAQ